MEMRNSRERCAEMGINEVCKTYRKREKEKRGDGRREMMGAVLGCCDFCWKRERPVVERCIF
jgi:hypothetical protein